MVYSVVVDPRVMQDIQQAVDYYDEQQTGLGKEFVDELNKYILALAKNPRFRIRYDNVHCMPLKRFPYMVHYTLHEERQIIAIMAVFHTSLNPKKWTKRK